MKNLSKLSDNELSELLGMTFTMIDTMREYSHVREYTPRKLVNELTNFYDNLCNEKDRREDEFQ